MGREAGVPKWMESGPEELPEPTSPRNARPKSPRQAEEAKAITPSLLKKKKKTPSSPRNATAAIDIEQVEEVQEVVAPATLAPPATERKEMKDVVRYGFSILTIVLAGLMGARAVFQLFSLASFTSFFVSIYILLFAGLLLVKESLVWFYAKDLDDILKQQFGLLYGTLGRALFIICLGALSFALDKPKGSSVSATLGWAITLMTFSQGIAMIVIHFKHPNYLE